MKRHAVAFGLLSSVVSPTFASVNIGDIKYENLAPGTYCITYLSTYLAPVSIETELPLAVSSSSDFNPISSLLSSESLEVVTTADASITEQSPSAPPSASTSIDFDPTGQAVIFAITPSQDTRKRDVGGFVGNGGPDVCTFATVYTLGQGRLFDGGLPIAYNGEAFQALRSSSVPSGDAITTTFSNNGGVLSFSNPSLPGGRASFCQTPSDGQVYLTFTSRPSGCQPVTLTIYGAERCINGRIDGLETSAIASESAQVTEQVSTQGPRSTDPSINMPDTTEMPPLEPSMDETVFPTLTIDPTKPLSFSNITSRQTTAERDPLTSGILFPSFPPSRPVEESSFATETLLPTIVFTSSVDQTASSVATPSDDEFPSSTVILSSSDLPISTLEVTSSSDVPESSSVPTSSVDETLSSIDIDTSSTMSTLITEDTSSLATTSETSTMLTTSFESTTDIPTTTTTTETTTTFEPIIITNAILNGKFEMQDPNSASGIMGYESEGDVSQHTGDCYTGDGSSDNGCAALVAAEGGKRSLGSFAAMWQMLGSLSPSRTVLYTVQFYYIAITVGRSQSCTVDAYLGSQQFYSQGLFSGGGVGVSWNRVLTMVRADTRDASLRISLSCTGTGQAMIYIDSIFVSNEITPDTIDQAQLDFGNIGNTPIETPIQSTPFQSTIIESTTLIESTTIFDTESTQTASSTIIEGSTTASQTLSASATPTDTCAYKHGERCDFDRFNYPKDVLCSWAGTFKGESWTVTRTEYQHQNTWEQCLAICHTLEGCRSAGWWHVDNRCRFSSKALVQEDFNLDGLEDWEKQTWGDIRCYADCEECIPESVPIPPSKKCSYTQGDRCTRNAAPEGVVCNYSAWMAGMFWTGDQWIKEYPHQASSEECAASCYAMSECGGFAYKDGRCKWTGYKLALSGMPVPLETDRDPSRNSVWDDPLCFTCPGCSD
ncbi:hypothetical protein BKA59DRAFT_555377 [Fusarium tricinctum]|uniref:DUF7908 domain-containing protein n=1 Tax=Fusarium tricinctum TaxID=61284 RepID=A0A8K0RVF7_9HYPO|nr:hypothetical protein BKA59DRAFT_555377 [Fusarium tricinctum]